MTLRQHSPTVIEFPNPLEVVLSRELAAPRELVFDVLTKPELVRKTIAPFGERVDVCSIDLRVGGSYHFVFVPNGGSECSFRGTFLEVTPPLRTVQTWHFDGWPDVEAVETHELQELDGGTKMIWKLKFRDQAGRSRMSKLDGPKANFDNVEDLVRALLDGKEAASK